MQESNQIDASPEKAAELAGLFCDYFPQEHCENMINEIDYSQYRDDPVGFCEEFFWEGYTDDIKEMMESVRDYQVTIAMSCNDVGKSHGSSRIAVWFYKVWELSQVLTAAAPPLKNLETILWGEIDGLVYKHPEMFATDTVNKLHIKGKSLADKHFLMGVTIPKTGTDKDREGSFGGNHAPQMLFVFDEGDGIPDPCYKGAETCLSGGLRRMLIIFNPREKKGAVYTMVKKKLGNVISLSAFNHPNVLSGKEVIPGAVTREVTVLRIAQMCTPLHKDSTPDATCFELPNFLKGQIPIDQKNTKLPALIPGWYKVDVPQFFHMVLGKYPPEGVNQLISQAWIDNARTRWDAHVAKFGEKPPLEVKGIMGLDAAEEGPDANSAVFRYGGWVDHPTRWANVDMIATGERGAEEYHKRDIIACGVCATGVGAGVAPHMMRKGCNAHSIKVAKSPTTKPEDFGDFKILRDQLWWACRTWLKDEPSAMLPPCEKLLEELACPTYEVINGTLRVQEKKDMKKVLGRSSDDADALCLTFAPDMNKERQKADSIAIITKRPYKYA